MCMCVCVYYTWAWSNNSVLISFHRTVNNFLMTGPKVNTFCAVYNFNVPYMMWICKLFKTHISSFPPTSRLFWPMLTASKLAHREAYKSANISSRGRDGTAQRTLCNYLHTVACEEVRCTSHCKKNKKKNKSEARLQNMSIIIDLISGFYARFTHRNQGHHDSCS